MSNTTCTLRWLLTGLYGEPETNCRQRTWDLLRDIAPQHPCPWMAIGDFNKILFQTKNVGGKQRSEFLMSNFRRALDECGLFDLGHNGD